MLVCKGEINVLGVERTIYSIDGLIVFDRMDWLKGCYQKDKEIKEFIRIGIPKEWIEEVH